MIWVVCAITVVGAAVALFSLIEDELPTFWKRKSRIFAAACVIIGMLLSLILNVGLSRSEAVALQKLEERDAKIESLTEEAVATRVRDEQIKAMLENIFSVVVTEDSEIALLDGPIEEADPDFPPLLQPFRDDELMDPLALPQNPENDLGMNLDLSSIRESLQQFCRIQNNGLSFCETDENPTGRAITMADFLPPPTLFAPVRSIRPVSRPSTCIPMMPCEME